MGPCKQGKLPHIVVLLQWQDKPYKSGDVPSNNKILKRSDSEEILTLKASLHGKRNESMVSDEELKEFCTADQYFEVIDKAFSIEKIIWGQKKVPSNCHNY